MSGVFLLVAVGISLWVFAWLAATLGNLAPNKAWRSKVKVGIFLVLLGSPFVDEVIGMYQFNALCKANGIESADVSKARGRRVQVDYGDRQFVSGTIMPIKVSDVRFTDAETGAVLIQHKNYYAMGGWLMRYTSISMGYSQSMLFDGNGCGFQTREAVFVANEIQQIN